MGSLHPGDRNKDLWMRCLLNISVEEFRSAGGVRPACVAGRGIWGWGVNHGKQRDEGRGGDSGITCLT